MKKTLKRVTTLFLVLTFLFCASSCGKENTQLMTFENPLSEKTYAELMDMATEIREDGVYATDKNNSFEIKSVKSKMLVVSGPAAIISAVTVVVSIFFGGFYTTPAVYTADEGERILEVKVKYTNNGSESVFLGDVIHTAFAVANENVFDGNVCCSSTWNSLDFTLQNSIEPGEDITMRILIDVPKDYVNNHNTFDINFDIEGSMYSLTYKK